MTYNPDIHHRRSIRLKGYNYSQPGMYFITLCCQNRKCLFGKVVNGQMVLNDMGQIAHNEWLKTMELRDNVELGEFVIMPNHFHAIIQLLFRWGECNSPQRVPSQTIGAIVRGYKPAVTKQLNLINNGIVVWQRNYYEHIIRDERSYERISKYIINNPAKWNDDKFYLNGIV